MRRLISVIFAGLLALAGCSSAPVSTDIPDPVVQWAQSNVMQVITEKGSGSGYWVDEATFLTACHVVSSVIMRGGTNEKTDQWETWEVHKVIEDVTLLSWDNEEYKGIVISCDRDTDLAIIKPTVNHPLDLRRAEIAEANPKMGKAVYGPGFALGMNLVITYGHWQGKSWLESDDFEGSYNITSPTIFGDSGSPAVVLRDGKVVVVGIRQWIANYGNGPTTHIVGVRPGKSLLDHLSQYNRL